MQTNLEFIQEKFKTRINNIVLQQEQLAIKFVTKSGIYLFGKYNVFYDTHQIIITDEIENPNFRYGVRIDVNFEGSEYLRKKIVGFIYSSLNINENNAEVISLNLQLLRHLVDDFAENGSFTRMYNDLLFQLEHTLREYQNAINSK